MGWFDILKVEDIDFDDVCANCKGEKDVFGNVYRGPEKKLNESSFQVHTVRTVGNYAVRIFWKDQHANGIYTFDFLKSLNESD